MNNNKTLYTTKIIKEFSHYLNKKFLNSRSNGFFKLLLGFNPIYVLEDDDYKYLEDFFLLIIYLRIIGGFNLEIEKLSKIVLINYDHTLLNSVLDNKFLIQDLITNYSKDDDGNYHKSIFFDYFNINKEEQINRNNINIAFPTYNRPEILKKTLREYINNIYYFKNINSQIYIFDDSDGEVSKINEININKLKSYYSKILYINKNTKYQLIKNLIKKCKRIFPNIDAEKFNYFIPYLFGGKRFINSYGRNRNFMSFYFKNKSFISIDDDSLPKVFTYSNKVILNSIKKIINLEKFDLSIMDSFIEENNKNSKNFLKVDFIGYFSNFKTKNIQYVKYSGSKDLETHYYLIKKLGFDFEDINVFNYLSNYIDSEKLKEIMSNMNNNTFVYGKKYLNSFSMKGLCSYLPGKNDLRVTLSENLRIEDLILGVNSYIYNSKKTIETSFALFHNKNKNPTSKEIHMELISTVIYSVYLHIIKKISFNDTWSFVNNFYNQIFKEEIFVSEEAFKILFEGKQEIFELFKNCLEYSRKSKNLSLERELENIINELKYEFFSLNSQEYKKYINFYTNSIFRDYSSSLLLWKTIEKITF